MALAVKNLPTNAGDVGSLGQKDPLEKETAKKKRRRRRKRQSTTVFLPGKSHGQRSLVSYSP